MTPLYLLKHDYMTEGGHSEVKFIGVYSSVENVEKAIAALRAQPGFKDHPEDLEYVAATVDFTNWRQGFVRLMPEEM